ncbi:hypothetical protein V5O48_001329 [Marasmius crinis-equi]|uniref:Uncharacterized protein n=1 Tax=Marasmius crinis-equi TaxID=585013 RepID=A0ABR3FZ08_9AGAR
MSNNHSVATGSPRSPDSALKTQLWTAPKSPLPPHRLAKLANALGVSTPVHHYPSFSTSSSSSLSPATLLPPEPFRRSPSPSASSMNFSVHAPTTSKFLLHVIPPLTIPHDSEFMEHSNLTPPPPTASGYHTQFRRGTLVTVHSTLQAQLWAIAREYALPSINGLVLYLVSNPQSPSLGGGEGGDEGLDEPGPRLSEEVWKHLWTRVWKAEQRDEGFASPISPALPGLGLGIGTRSTPHLPQEGNSPNVPGRPLKQLLSSSSSTTSDSQPFSGAPYPSPSTPSSTSGTPLNNSYPARSTSSHSLPSRTETPDTSLPSDIDSVRANSLDLPGLRSPGIIPILAKVEFDIDRKKAAWYDPWLRSRKMNQSKRKKALRANSDNSAEPLDLKQPPIALRLKGRAMTASPISMFEQNANGYEQLEDEDSDEESNYDDDATARIASTGKDDPLADVFGDDADTWADMRDHNRARRSNNDPNVVDLALTGGELSALPDEDEDEHDGDGNTDVDEVQEMMTTALNRKNVPPPLNLRVGVSNTELAIPSPQKSGNSSGSTALPYLQGESPLNEVAVEQHEEDLDENEHKSLKSATDSEKRVGGVFEDLDLGLDPTEDFEIDRRHSQYLFSEQLDEIERNLAQLSPRALKVELESNQSLSFADQQFLDLPPGALRNGDVLPPSPRKGHFDTKPESERINSDKPPTAPRLAVNGVATNASPPRKPPSVSAGLILPRNPSSSEESPIIPLSPDPFGRYPSSPPEHAPQTNSKRNSSTYWDSVPVGVPTENLKKHRESIQMSQSDPRASTKSSRFSADSTKDEGEEVQIQVKGKGGVVSMKSIKRLWRKSNKNSVASVTNLPPIPPTPTIASAPSFSPVLATQQQAASKSTPELSLNSPINPGFTYPSRPPSQQSQLNTPPIRPPSQQSQLNTPPIRPPRPSQEEIELPDIPDQLNIPLQPASGRPAPMPIIAAQMIHGRRSPEDVMDRLHFDQESPYPTARRKPPSRPTTPTSRPTTPSGVGPSSQPAPPPVPQDAGQRASIRKSILKWKSAAQSSGSDQNGNRARKLSIGNLVPSKSSNSAYPEGIPPSPSIPEHFLNSRPSQASSHTHSQSSIDSRVDSLHSSPPRTSKSSATSTASPPPRTSKDSLPGSFDDSQFEIISPKVGTLSYPYHNLEEAQ